MASFTPSFHAAVLSPHCLTASLQCGSCSLALSAHCHSPQPNVLGPYPRTPAVPCHRSSNFLPSPSRHHTPLMLSSQVLPSSALYRFTPHRRSARVQAASASPTHTHASSSLGQPSTTHTAPSLDSSWRSTAPSRKTPPLPPFAFLCLLSPPLASPPLVTSTYLITTPSI